MDIYIIEDFNLPKYYKYLNDSNNKEIYIDEILKILNKKNILNLISYQNLNKNIYLKLLKKFISTKEIQRLKHCFLKIK